MARKLAVRLYWMWRNKPLDYERAVVVDAAGQRKRTRPLAGVNGEVCKEKRKKLWKESKKDLTRASIVRDGREHDFAKPLPRVQNCILDFWGTFRETGLLFFP